MRTGSRHHQQPKYLSLFHVLEQNASEQNVLQRQLSSQSDVQELLTPFEKWFLATVSFSAQFEHVLDSSCSLRGYPFQMYPYIICFYQGINEAENSLKHPLKHHFHFSRTGSKSVSFKSNRWRPRVEFKLQLVEAGWKLQKWRRVRFQMFSERDPRRSGQSSDYPPQEACSFYAVCVFFVSLSVFTKFPTEKDFFKKV